MRGSRSWSAAPRVLGVLAASLLLHALPAAAQTNPDFNVTVNTGPVAPNADTVFPGQPTSLRITLSNNSLGAALTNVSYSGALQVTGTAGLLIDGPSAISGDPGCVGGALTTVPGQPDIALAGLTVPPRQDGVPGSGECYIDLPVRAFTTNGASTTLNLLVSPGDVIADQGGNATGGPQAITVRSVQRPTFTKAFVPNNLLLLGGPPRTLRITVTNPDPNISLTDVGLADIFPTSGAGGAVIEPTGTPAGGSCVSGAGGAVALTGGAGARVDVSGVTLPPGGSCTVDVEVRARQSDGAYQLTATNTLSASDFSSREGPTPSADAAATLRVRSPLAVGKVFDPPVLASGTQGTFTVTLTNSGDAPLNVASFTDDPIGTPGSGNLNIASPAAIGNSCLGGTSSLESGGQGFSVGGFTIPANGTCAITVTFTAVNTSPDTPVAYTNNIPEGAVAISGQPGIVSQARSATLIVADRLRVLKARSPSAAAPGDAVRYDITLQNFSATPQNDVTLSDSFQNGSTLLLGGAFDPTVSAACGPLDTGGAAQGDGGVRFTIATLPARSGAGNPGECVVSLWVMIDPAATTSTSNVVGVGDVCLSDGVTCNQGASNTVTTTLRAPVDFEKTFDGLNAVTRREGVVTRLRLALRNFSTSPLADVVFSDTLPEAGPFKQLRIASPANVSNSCGGTVTAAPASTSLALNGGAVPAFSAGNPGECAVEVDVVGPAGIYPNEGLATGNRPNADGSVTPIAPVGSSLSDTATLTYTNTLAAAKSFEPTVTGPGGRSTLTVRLENLDGNAPITGIGFTDPLPAGMVVADPAGAYSTCGGAPVIDAVPGAASLAATGITLAPLATCAVIVDVEVTGSSDWVNTIPPGNLTADGGIVNTAPVLATLRFQPPDVPLLSKSINPGTIVPGQSSQLTINITNGADTLSGVELVDWFTDGGLPAAAPNGMRIADDAQASSDCPEGVVTAVPGSDNVRLSGARLAPNASCQVRVRVTSTSVGTITNRIPLGALVSDQGATNSTTFAESTLSTTSTLGVTKRFEPAVVSPSQPSRLRIAFFNGDPSAVTDFALTDTYPAGLVNAPDPNPVSNCGAAVVDFPGPASVRIRNGSLGAAVGAEAATCFLEVDVVAASEGSYRNEIPENTLTVRGVPVAHPPAEATLEARPRIVINKAFDGFTLDAGDPSGFVSGNAVRLPGQAAPLVIRLENPNTIALTELRFTDSLPEGLSLAAAPGASTDCPDGIVTAVPFGRELRLTGARLPPGASCTVSAEVVSNQPGVYDNEIAAGAVSSVEGIDNDPATQARIVVSEPPSVAKDFAPPVIPPNGIARLTLALGNGNDVPATLLVDLVDTLPVSPGAMRIATPPGVSSTCTGSVAATAGGSTVGLSAGAVIPPGGCLVEVDVTAAEPGTYLNTIPAGALRTDLGVSDRATEATLTVSTLGYISGRVFLDNQAVPDGRFLPGASTPIGGNPIELRSGSDCGGALLATTTTDAQGNYLFADLSAGTYSVCQNLQPADTLNSVTTEGSIVPLAGSTGSPGTASNSGLTTSQITGIVLGDNGDPDEVSGSPDNNFSEVLPASIGGNVYFDADGDGVFDAGESGIGGVTIQLTGPVNRVTTTAADGSWSFSGLPPGEYTVTELQPDGWQDGIDARGSIDGTPTGDDSASDVITAIALGPGAVGTDYNFGEIAPLVLLLDAAAACSDDIAWVDYRLPGFTGATAPAVQVRWLTTDGRVVEVLSDQPGSGRLLWPGMVLDGTGQPTGWPGWVFVDGAWERVPDDRVPELVLEITVNPTTTVTLSYPPATAACAAQPPGTFRVQAVPTAPQWMLLVTALFMVLAAGRARATRRTQWARRRG